MPARFLQARPALTTHHPRSTSGAMKPSQIALGLWNHADGAESGPELLRLALETGIRTFITADSFGRRRRGPEFGRGHPKFRGQPRGNLRDRRNWLRSSAKRPEAATPRAGRASPATRDEADFADFLRFRGQILAPGHRDRRRSTFCMLQDPDRDGFRSHAVWDAHWRKRGMRD